MKKQEIDKLAQHGIWQAKPLNGKLIETHISWVILADELVFKIKRPVKFSFVDFSTLNKRKESCFTEVELNSRLSDIYFDVQPIRNLAGAFLIGEGDGEIVDYAVRMKKVDPSKEMEEMLERDAVKPSQMEDLASILADFHGRARVIKNEFDLEKMRSDFNDLKSVEDQIKKNLKKNYSKTLKETIAYGNSFLDEYSAALEKRSVEGMIRDLHGDFHSGNIFLTDPPIIFDCIEFNEKLRHVDVLDEIAFLCMDLESHDRQDLSKVFLNAYLDESRIEYNVTEREIFRYYKVYRANVRAKVSALGGAWDLAENYLKLIDAYLD